MAYSVQHVANVEAIEEPAVACVVRASNIQPGPHPRRGHFRPQLEPLPQESAHLFSVFLTNP